MIRRGEIYYATLDPVQGHEQAGRRPVIVLSRDSINQAPLTVTVMIGSDAAHFPRDYSTNVRIPARESGLPMDTVFLGFQIRSLDHSRFLDPVRKVLPPPAGRLSTAWMAAIEAAICHALEIRPRRA
jgi:mRNA interferase MazF